VVVCLAVAVGAIVVGAGDERAPRAPERGAPPTAAPTEGALVYRQLDQANPEVYRRIAWAPGAQPGEGGAVSQTECDRVYYAAGRGLCLARQSSVLPKFDVATLGRGLDVQKTFELSGSPSRTRVSPDGRYGAVTAFVSGHSYAEAGAFSTRTDLIDMAAAKSLGDLEKFAITRDGKPFEERDFNFWGVSFEPTGDGFYATLGSGGRTYLVRGDVSDKAATVVRENAECPSLAPDGTRVAYKKRVKSGGGGQLWRFHVLDLESGEETPLAEKRSIDDQVEWLDGDTIVYGVGVDLWQVPADGSGSARRLLANADSPAAVR
jgi:Tol biopolymer transport system component